MLRPYRSVFPAVRPSAFVAAGALVPEGMIVPPGSMVMGMPGTVRRPLTPEEDASITRATESYVRYRLDFQAAETPA